MHRRHRLRGSADFSRVMRSGHRTTTPGLAVYHLESGASEVARVGFSIGRGLGNAVVRNRTRRLLREAVRTLLPSMASRDVVVVARSAAVGVSEAELARSVRDALSAAGLLGAGPDDGLGGMIGEQNPAPDVTEGTSS